MEIKTYDSIMEDYQTLVNHLGWIQRERIRDILFNREGETIIRKSEKDIMNITPDEEKELSGMLDDVIEKLFDTMGGN